MRIISMFLCLFMVILGLKMSLIDYNKDGAVIVIIGALSFLIINSKRVKI